MRVPNLTRCPRRQLLRHLLASVALSAAPPLAVLPAVADAAAPTYSLKGLAGSIMGADAPRPSDQLGVIGRGTNKDKTGRLNACETGKKGCISTFSQYDEDSYVPPWTYQPGYSLQATSSFDARRQQLREAAGVESSDTPTAAPKSRTTAEAELKAAIEAASGRIVAMEDRYVYAEFEDLASGVIDDVEFLFSLDSPIVGYRSAARRGGDDKRQRNRIRDLRKSLKTEGWKSVGRAIVE